MVDQGSERVDFYGKGAAERKFSIGFLESYFYSKNENEELYNCNNPNYLEKGHVDRITL